MPTADLPLLLIFDDEWRYVDQWGPHPEAIDPYLDEWLAAHPDFEALADDDSSDESATYAALLAELTYAMRLWYNTTLNQACAVEVRDLLTSSDDEADADDDDAMTMLTTRARPMTIERGLRAVAHRIGRGRRML